MLLCVYTLVLVCSFIFVKMRNDLINSVSMFAVLMWFYNLRIASYELPGPTDKEKPGGEGGQGAPSWQPGPKVVPFSDFNDNFIFYQVKLI